MRKDEGEETSREIFSAKNANILYPNLLLSMFPVNGKKEEEENIFHMDILLAIMQVIVTHMNCVQNMIMGMINETSQNDQKEKSLRDLTTVKYHCPLLEPILVNDRSFTNSHGGQFSFRRNSKNG